MAYKKTKNRVYTWFKITSTISGKKKKDIIYAREQDVTWSIKTHYIPEMKTGSITKVEIELDK